MTRTKAGVIFLYWVASNGDIQRVTKSDGKWEVSTGAMTKFKVNKVLKESQLAVTHAEVHGEFVNHVVYIEKNDTEYTNHVDVLA